MVTSAPVVPWLVLGGQVTVSESGGLVIYRVTVRGTSLLGLVSESARSSMQLLVGLWDQLVIESRCGVLVCGLV